jgi:hypothetical protein
MQWLIADLFLVLLLGVPGRCLEKGKVCRLSKWERG